MEKVSYFGKSIPQRAKTIFIATLFTALAAITSAISQLQLSPIYGSLPAMLHHKALISTAFSFAWFSSQGTREAHSSRRYVIVLMLGLYRFVAWLGTYLGPRYGPLLTEVLTLTPLIVSATMRLPGLTGRRLSSSIVLSIADFMFKQTLFSALENWFSKVLPVVISMSSICDRRRLWFVTNWIHFLIPTQPNARWLYGLLGLALLWPHTMLDNYLTLRNLNMHHYELLEARESITGYVSVIEDTEKHMRALRCDHSLLGGVWLPQGAWAEQGVEVPEPIFTVFTMLEAVRLMELVGAETSKPDRSKSALVVGLGIGTSPSALAAHGINTTVVEIDPAVSHLATKYFELPSTVTIVNDDALTLIPRFHEASYDHIIHDVFTGGAEALDLFTFEFLAQLRTLLAPDGTIAINYATHLPFTPRNSRVVTNILWVYTACRAYRDTPPSDAPDFVNLVLFCTLDPNEWYFRAPTESDFLRSQTRREHLPPRWEVDLSPVARMRLRPLLTDDVANDALREEREAGALRHWGMMREMLPGAVWNNW